MRQRTDRAWRPIALCLLAALIGCDDAGQGTGGADDAGAPRSDAIVDATVDAMPDAMHDAMLDDSGGSRDAMPGEPDAIADGMQDVGVTTDAMLDATLDAIADEMDGAADASIAVDGAPPDGAVPEGCQPGVRISDPEGRLPEGVAGHYAEGIDCTRDEGGAWFGQADFTRCFRKDDWRVWNTGCGWVVGRYGVPDGERVLLTWSGLCDALPPAQLDTRALTTGVLYDGFGRHVEGVRLDHCPDPAPCEPGVRISGAHDDVPPAIAGEYEAATCGRRDGGAWFGGVDFSDCFDSPDGDWRIWNTGCGWTVGRFEGAAREYERYALTYAGVCAEMSPDQRSPSALTTGLLYGPDGRILEGLRADHCRTPSGFAPGVQVIDRSGARPPAYAGRYVEARDCTRDEGGAWFGGDYTRCFRKSDRSPWRIWNTGCGWEIGQREAPRAGGQWQRVARTYTGVCADMPHWQLDLRGLTGHPLVDGFGATIEGLHMVHTPDDGPCSPDAVVTLEGDGVPADIAGRYVQALDCTREEGGAWFGGDYTRCFRKEDGSAWRIWNSGCGWLIGRREGPANEWRRYALTYTGVCAEMPPLQLDRRALTTGVLFDGFGTRIEGLRVDHCAADAWSWRH